ncbi:MAG: hypothetical protein J6P49_04790 [Paludibacteraceae bacterium]|nr:hypothetical protein [Paludibacteraceae bacterium]
MKKIAIAVVSVALVAMFASCSKGEGKFGINDKASDETKVFDKKVEGEADLIDKAEALQNKVDDIFMKNNVYVELYVEMKDDSRLIKVDNFDDLKDKGKVAKTYNIVRYESGALMNVTEMPNPMGREFENIYNSLYDEQGNLVKFQRVSRFMIEQVSQFIETSSYYFDSKHEAVKKDYKILDLFNMDRVVSAAEADNSPGRIQYDVFLTAKDFNEAHPIK